MSGTRSFPLSREYSLNADGKKVIATRSMDDSDDSQFDFLEEPSQDYYCPVSLEVMQSPQLTDCCGHHLSLPVAEKLHQDRRPCPVCKRDSFVTHKDLYFERKVRDLKVRCPYKSRGCDWVGELRDLDLHRQTCHKQPWICPDCSEVMCKDAGGDNHFPNCPNQRIPCPNGCDVPYISAFDKSKHLEECPLQMVSCKYAESGCSIRVTRKDMEKHLQDEVQQHMMALTLCSYEAIKNLNLRFDQVGQSSGENKATPIDTTAVLELKDEEIRRLRQELQTTKECLARQNAALNQVVALKEVHQEVQDVLKFSYSTSVEFSLTRYTECKSSSPDGNWCSPPFYYPSDGYNMELSIDTNGYDKGAGTHLSAYINPNRGSFDAGLRWPVVCKVYLVLLNQCGDFGHYGKSAVFEWKMDCQDYQTISYAYIPFDKLELDPVRNTQYLKDDCLHFKLYLDIRPKLIYKL